MGDNFHSDLARYVKSRDNENATRVVLHELAKALVKDKESFIEVMRNADLSVMNDATDIQLINGFIDNAPTNKKLLIGASYLVNHRNQQLNFDGEEEVSDSGVKDSYKVMDDFFNVGGWADAIKGVADLGGNITNKIADRNKGASNQLAQQTSARKEMIQNVIAQRQKEADNKLKEGGKNKRTLLIVGGITLALVLGLGIYFAVKKK